MISCSAGGFVASPPIPLAIFSFQPKLSILSILFLVSSVNLTVIVSPLAWEVRPFSPFTLSVPLHKPTLGLSALLKLAFTPLYLFSFPSIFIVKDLSCATFTASVNSLPAATLVIWRLMSLLPEPPPTETAPIALLSTLCVDLKPLATVLPSVVTE